MCNVVQCVIPPLASQVIEHYKSKVYNLEATKTFSEVESQIRGIIEDL